MALADERRLAATAETAAALLAHHRLVQDFRDQFRRCALAYRIGDDRKCCAHFSDRRKIRRLLARIFCRPDFALQLRDIAARARHHARARIQRIHCRCNFLRSVRLSTAARTRSLVPCLLDLLCARLPYEKFARFNLSVGDFSFTRRILSRGAAALPQIVPLGVYVNLRGAVCSLVRSDRAAFSWIFTATVADRMVGTSAFLFQRSRER